MAAGSPLVSVVVPTHDRPERLVDALESVAAQTYDPVELVVVDDGSRADVRSLVGDLGLEALESVQAVEHAESKGANAARNAGVRAASGDYVAFLDDDDRWLAEKLERQVEVLQATAEEVTVVYTGQRFVDSTGATTNVTAPTADGPFLEELVQGTYFGPFSTVLVDAGVFDATGPLRDGLPCWQDREWYLRLAEYYEYATVPAPLTVRRVTGDGVSAAYEARRDEAYPQILEAHADRIANHGEAYERQFRATMARCLGGAAILDGRYAEAVRFLLHSLRQDPTARRSYAYLGAALGGPVTHVAARTAKRWVNRLRAPSRPEPDAEATEVGESAAPAPAETD